jgi:hypothetical protein
VVAIDEFLHHLTLAWDAAHRGYCNYQYRHLAHRLRLSETVTAARLTTLNDKRWFIDESSIANAAAY